MTVLTILAYNMQTFIFSAKCLSEYEIGKGLKSFFFCYDRVVKEVTTMNAAERRIKITHLIAQSDGPVSATALAAQCGVSRQIIVGDVALLRAGGLAVLATPRGYILENPAAPVYAERRVVCHHGDERLREELYTVVDLGGALIDVTVEHPVYGQICAPLHIFSRFDADAFCKKIQNPGTRPLCDLTGGIHLHTLRAADEATLSRVVRGLKDGGFLLTEER